MVSREIKFRAWDKKIMGMRYDGEVCAKVNPYKCIDQFDILNRDDFELMQYTGLKDKNGKEIYESDIVKLAGFGILNINDGEIIEVKSRNLIEGNTSYEEAEFIDCEVIGNIYENSELINKEVK